MPAPLSWEKGVSANTREIMNVTEQKWMGWFENAGSNMTEIRNGLDISAIPKRKGPAVIVGGGPSFRRYNHDSVLSEFRDRIPTIISTDKMLKSLLAVQVEPHFVASLDGDPIVSEFYKIHSDERFPKTHAVFDAVSVHPLTLKAAKENLAGNIYWFVHLFDNPLDPRCSSCNRLSLTAAYHYLTGGKQMIQAPGNVGAFAWHLAHYLGCNPIIMVGMDMGYASDTPIQKTIYYSAFIKGATVEHLYTLLSKEAMGKLSQQDIETHASGCADCKAKARLAFQIRTNPDFHNKYMIDLMFDAYRELMLPFIKRTPVATINATGGGALHGERITGMEFSEALRKYCP